MKPLMKLYGYRRQRGIALLLVLWALILLTVIAGSLTTTVRTELSMAGSLVDEVRGRALIEAGFTYVLANYLGGNRAEVEEMLPADGRLREWVFDGHRLRVGLTGEDGRIDLNLADEALIKGALLSVGLDAQVAEEVGDAIADWRDVDDLHRLAGAEDTEYERAGFLYGAKDGRFESVAELGLVYGVNKSIYDLIAPLFTVYSGTKTINSRHADRAVLLAIPGVSADLVDAFIESRDSENPLGSGIVLPGADSRYVAAADGGVYRLLSAVELPSGIELYGEMTVDLRPRGRKRYRILRVSYNAPAPGTGIGQEQGN
jgi:general secretion pathway protein K